MTTQLINNFIAYNNEHSLGQTAIALYLLLVKEAEKQASFSFKLSNLELIKMLSINYRTLAKAKKLLSEHKFIDCYQSKKTAPCSYIIKHATENIAEATTIIEKDKNSTTQVLSPKVLKEESNRPTKSKKIKQEQNKKIASSPQNDSIPSYEEFLAFAKTIEIYDPSIPNIDFQIKNKYETWKNNGWKSGYGTSLTKIWKQSLKNTLPFLISFKQPKNEVMPKKINRPKMSLE